MKFLQLDRMLGCGGGCEPAHTPRILQARPSIIMSLAGMDGNRTHLGRLSTAPQTVLKVSGFVRRGPPGASTDRGPPAWSSGSCRPVRAVLPCRQHGCNIAERGSTALLSFVFTCNGPSSAWEAGG